MSDHNEVKALMTISTTARRLHGIIDPVHAGSKGGWIRRGGAGGEYWYFFYASNPHIRPNIDGGARVEFTLVYDDRGRPLAVDVQVIRGQA